MYVLGSPASPEKPGSRVPPAPGPGGGAASRAFLELMRRTEGPVVSLQKVAVFVYVDVNVCMIMLMYDM